MEATVGTANQENKSSSEQLHRGKKEEAEITQLINSAPRFRFFRGTSDRFGWVFRITIIAAVIAVAAMTTSWENLYLVFSVVAIFSSSCCVAEANEKIDQAREIPGAPTNRLRATKVAYLSLLIASVVWFVWNVYVVVQNGDLELLKTT